LYKLPVNVDLVLALFFAYMCVQSIVVLNCKLISYSGKLHAGTQFQGRMPVICFSLNLFNHYTTDIML